MGAMWGKIMYNRQETGCPSGRGQEREEGKA